MCLSENKCSSNLDKYFAFALMFLYCSFTDKDCRTSSTDRGYSGTLNITLSGSTCHMWSDRSQLPSGGPLPDYNTELMNFCRTPIDDSERMPWCYTTNPIKRWEICDVPLCGEYNIKKKRI